ncbi:putative signal peptide protein [Puccinia sorghi]|uniref:Putative signal peptide protein n=1 Tax=Puccinia sorghi TaxID=27349 RepID=A0A0L6UYF4_9BASI|nr:putative signal peptide protein [Puccinia sorghi]
MRMLSPSDNSSSLCLRWTLIIVLLAHPCVSTQLIGIYIRLDQRSGFFIYHLSQTVECKTAAIYTVWKFCGALGVAHDLNSLPDKLSLLQFQFLPSFAQLTTTAMLISLDLNSLQINLTLILIQKKKKKGNLWCNNHESFDHHACSLLFCSEYFSYIVNSCSSVELKIIKPCYQFSLSSSYHFDELANLVSRLSLIAACVTFKDEVARSQLLPVWILMHVWHLNITGNFLWLVVSLVLKQATMERRNLSLTRYRSRELGKLVTCTIRDCLKDCNFATDSECLERLCLSPVAAALQLEILLAALEAPGKDTVICCWVRTFAPQLAGGEDLTGCYEPGFSDICSSSWPERVHKTCKLTMRRVTAFQVAAASLHGMFIQGSRSSRFRNSVTTTGGPRGEVAAEIKSKSLRITLPIGVRPREVFGLGLQLRLSVIYISLSAI